MSDRARVRIQWRYKDKSGTYEEEPSSSGSVWFDDEGEPSLFMWEEGNYSCDCNRADFFGLADRDNEAGFPCGNTIEILSIEVIR